LKLLRRLPSVFKCRCASSCAALCRSRRTDGEHRHRVARQYPLLTQAGITTVLIDAPSLRIDPQGSAIQKQRSKTEWNYERKRRDHDELQRRLPMLEGAEPRKCDVHRTSLSNAEKSEAAGRRYCEGFTVYFGVCDVPDVSPKFQKRTARER
jgi:hypothetical protein